MTSCTRSVDWGFLGFEKKQWVEFLPPNERVEIQRWARADEFVPLSLSSCRITFNSKVLKFRTWTNFVKVVYFGFPLSISHVRILWVCYIFSNKKIIVNKIIRVKNTWNYLTECKKMSSNSFKNVIYKMYLQIIYIYTLPSSAANQGVSSPWLAADEGRISHMLSHVVWWKYINIYIYKEDLTWNNLQWLICHKIRPNQTELNYYYYITVLGTICVQRI